EIDALVPSTIILVDHALVRTFYKGAIGTIEITGDNNLEIFAVPGSTPAPGEGNGESNGPSAQNGATLFGTTCSACHGPDASGVAGLGPSLIGNVFVAGLSDSELITFIMTGRPADHPDNVTGVAMPPSGGNLSLTPEDLADLAAFLRSLG
ncbi:MAG: cytochrome c, partial [Acidimicrobiia bacterium]|nr:cytochrome c [Acidimicrobiia bacterium]